MSVAGANGTTMSGMTYQNPFFLFQNESVRWIPQAYLGGSQWHYYYSGSGGAQTYYAFYARMDHIAGNCTYRAYVYPTERDFLRDGPLVYTWSNTTCDTNFIIGTQSYGGHTLKHEQFGVESNYRITGTEWMLGTTQPCYYYDDDWRYMPAYVTYGSTAAITYYSSQPWGVGGATYTGVNTDFTGADGVYWTYSGTTISDSTTLWASGGVTGDFVDTPYS